MERYYRPARSESEVDQEKNGRENLIQKSTKLPFNWEEGQPGASIEL